MVATKSMLMNRQTCGGSMSVDWLSNDVKALQMSTTTYSNVANHPCQVAGYQPQP